MLIMKQSKSWLLFEKALKIYSLVSFYTFHTRRASRTSLPRDSADSGSPYYANNSQKYYEYPWRCSFGTPRPSRWSLVGALLRRTIHPDLENILDILSKFIFILTSYVILMSLVRHKVTRLPTTMVAPPQNGTILKPNSKAIKSKNQYKREKAKLKKAAIASEPVSVCTSTYMSLDS